MLTLYIYIFVYVYHLQASQEFQHKVSEELLPKLRAFRPNLLFLSAGFDGHCEDLYHYLTDDDYRYVDREREID